MPVSREANPRLFVVGQIRSRLESPQPSGRVVAFPAPAPAKPPSVIVFADARNPTLTSPTRYGDTSPSSSRSTVIAGGSPGAEAIEYERWADAERVPQGAAPEEVLAAYAHEIEQLKAKGGYVTADVIDVTAQTPNLEAMLDKFRTEHWHDEDEVRFIIQCRGLFHILPQDSPVVAIEVESGDLIRVRPGEKVFILQEPADQKNRAPQP